MTGSPGDPGGRCNGIALQVRRQDFSPQLEQDHWHPRVVRYLPHEHGRLDRAPGVLTVKEQQHVFWNIFRNMAVSDKGETITRLSDTTSVSSTGVTYTQMGNMTVGSDGSTFTQIGSFSTDGSVRMGSSATGRGALFNEKQDALRKFGMDDDSEW